MGALVGMSKRSGWRSDAPKMVSNGASFCSDALKMVSNEASFCSDALKMVSNEVSFCSDTPKMVSNGASFHSDAPSVHFFDGFGDLVAAGGSRSEGTDRSAAGDGKEEMKDGVLLRP